MSAQLRSRSVCSLLLLFGALVAVSRIPLAPRRLFSFDDVNLAYALDEFNPRAGHPQPPYYPLFVLQMRLLSRLIDRPETILLVLKCIASLTALLAIVWVGERMFARGAGLCAAWLLLFHHSFWYGGLTSALRTELAVISLAVAGTCYRAWSGERRWVLASAVALGVGAGVRPELGLLLLPLWTVSVLRSGAGGRRFAQAAGLLAAIVLAWLVPTILQSGGLRACVTSSWEYLRDQSVLTSGLFGADQREWWASVVRLLLWTASGAVLWPVAAGLAWRREDGFGFGWTRAAFVALWILPSFLFAALVHIADAGHALAMVPATCLAGGWLLNRAASRLEPWFGRDHALVAVLLPCLALNALIFLGRFSLPSERPATRLEALWLDIHDAMDLSSLGQIRRMAAVDDRAVDQVGRLAAERPSNVVLIWEGAQESWRKAAYYFPHLQVIAFAPKTLHNGSALVATKFVGPRPAELIEGASPLRIPLPAGARVLWMIDSRGPALSRLQRRFPLRRAGPVFYHDLPEEDGEADLGAYVLVWRSTPQKTTLIPRVNCRWPCPFSPVMVPNALFTGVVFGAPN